MWDLLRMFQCRKGMQLDRQIQELSREVTYLKTHLQALTKELIDLKEVLRRHLDEKD